VRFWQGSLDILVQRGGNSGASRKAVFIKNNYFHDAFFLKALGAPSSVALVTDRLTLSSRQSSTALVKDGVNLRGRVRSGIG
jgi:hypothetical protein